MGGKDSPESLIAGVRDGPASHLSCPNAAGQRWARDPRGRRVFHSCQNATSEMSNFSQLREEDLQSCRSRVRPWGKLPQKPRREQEK